MPFTIVRQDITKMKVDAIVNAANTDLQMGGGVCGAIFKAAGAEKLQEACNAVAPIKTGGAAITPGFALPAKYVIHAVGPIYSHWNQQQNEEYLRSAYLESLKLAEKNKCGSIAFPLISSGIYGYPKAEALEVATSAITEYLKEHEMDVYLAVFDKTAFIVSEKLLGEVESYIDEHYVETHQVKRRQLLEVEEAELSDANLSAFLAAPSIAEPQGIDELINDLDEPFSDTLLKLIDSKGKTDVEVYKKANIDRKLFSKIRTGKGYTPKKPTILALAVALELSLDETDILLERAGYALSHANKVTVKKKDGSTEIIKAKVFNFDEPEKNHFLAVKEMKIHGTHYRRRTDIVGFVNGIPLLFVELKKQTVDVQDAYNCNYTDYLDTIPQLFYFNAFLMLSNGLEAKVGTMGSKFEFFHEWKRLKEDEAGAVDLETMLLGICEKHNFLDLLENFVLFDHSGGRTAKILARNHQYLGVNEAIDSYKARKLKDGKLGVFWHTQGSGKSYSMVFFAQKVRRKFVGSPTFVILTDRDELNKQISDTFEACGCLSAKASTYIPSSGKALRDMLKGNPSYIFTLIQKFNDEKEPPITPEHDIIVLSDEAHRSQNGIFADNMVRLLPTASRLGFTGTPLFKYDNITERTFGSYVSIYDFKRAVDDGATVPLYYENRSDMLGITNPEINDELLNAVEAADLDVNEQAKLELELRRDIHIITSEPRLDAIAKDFVDHYSELWTTGKAMFVCVNKVTCVRMYDLAQKYWAKKISELEGQLSTVSQQEAQELERKIEWMKETEMAVVVSQEQNEIQTFRNWNLDIAPHREKMEKRELDKEFKDSANPFRIVFVCAMWLTGFDVKSLATIYLDKPLKAHTLMQTIARANRVCDGKSNGLIVDYIGVVKALREALADYTNGKGGQGGQGDDPTPDKADLIQKILDTIKAIEAYMKEHNFELKKLVDATDFEKLALVAQGANAMCATSEIKKTFEIQARELFRTIKYVDRKELPEEAFHYKNAISAVYDQLQEKRKHADNSALMAEINEIVSGYVSVTKATGSEDGKKFDISNIDFDRLRKEFERVQNKNLLFKDLQDIVEDRLRRMMASNPLRIDYYERYQKIVDEYNKDNRKDEIAIIFENLMNLVNEMDEEQRRYVREGFDSDEELTMFDLLVKDSLTKDEIKKVKKLAQTLLTKIKERIHELDHWRDKEETQSIISVMIRDLLWAELPESYDDNAIADYRQQIFEYVYSAYPAA